MIAFIVYVHMPTPRIPAGAGPDSYAYLVIDFLSDTVLRCCVTVLTVLSGYLFFALGHDQGKLHTVKRKLQTLAIPFLVWNVSLAAAMFCLQYLGLVEGTRLNLASGDIKPALDATLSLTTRPVNYPLYFLRDLLVIALVSLVASGFIRRAPILAVLVALFIAEYNLDGFAILRTPMLPAFLIGGALAIYNVDVSQFDTDWKLLLIIFISACIFCYNFPSSVSMHILAAFGTITAWSVAGTVARHRIGNTLQKLSPFSFPVFLVHGAVLFLALGFGLRVDGTLTGGFVWLITPALVIVASALGFKLLSAISPRFVAFAFAGRTAG
jgi:succinoglycan biosynthesis protein ExoH